MTTPFKAIDKLHPHGHKGLDLAMPLNTEIHAASGGEVIFSGWDDKLGNYIKVHGYDGTDVIYGHLNECKVHTGDWIIQGQEIALSGSTGRSTGPHLHLQASVDGKVINPNEYAERLGGFGNDNHKSVMDHIHNVSDFIKDTRQEGMFYAITGKHFKEWALSLSHDFLFTIVHGADLLVIAAMLLGIGSMVGSQFCKKWLFYSVVLYIILKTIGGFL